MYHKKISHFEMPMQMSSAANHCFSPLTDDQPIFCNSLGWRTSSVSWPQMPSARVMGWLHPLPTSLRWQPRNRWNTGPASRSLSCPQETPFLCLTPQHRCTCPSHPHLMTTGGQWTCESGERKARGLLTLTSPCINDQRMSASQERMSAWLHT